VTMGVIFLFFWSSWDGMTQKLKLVQIKFIVDELKNPEYVVISQRKEKKTANTHNSIKHPS
jgi:hypothetical protein